MTWTPRHHQPLPGSQLRISLLPGEPCRLEDGSLLMFFADRVGDRYVLQLVLVPLEHRTPGHAQPLELDGVCRLGPYLVRCATSYVDELQRVQLVDLLFEPATSR